MIWYFPEGILDTLIAVALVGTALGAVSLVLLLIRDNKRNEVWTTLKIIAMQVP